MTIWRYTCQGCGLVTRVVDNQDYRACACKTDYDVVNEDEEAALAEVPPDAS